MNDAERIKFKIGSPMEEIKKRVPCNFTILTLNDVDRIIDERELEEEMKSELKKMARNYPFQALPTFIKNIDRNISKIRNNK